MTVTIADRAAIRAAVAEALAEKDEALKAATERIRTLLIAIMQVSERLPFDGPAALAPLWKAAGIDPPDCRADELEVVKLKTVNANLKEMVARADELAARRVEALRQAIIEGLREAAVMRDGVLMEATACKIVREVLKP